MPKKPDDPNLAPSKDEGATVVECQHCGDDKSTQPPAATSPDRTDASDERSRGPCESPAEAPGQTEIARKVGSEQAYPIGSGMSLNAADNGDVPDEPRERFATYELRPNPRAMVRLTLGSSVAIATALVIPDSFAIMPTVESTTVWLMRVAGLWLSAYMLWAAGFIGLLYLMRLVSGGIVLDDDGIKLWRLARKISWQDIIAINIVERKFFSRMFFIWPCVLQMMLHVRKPGGKAASVKQIPSFQYLGSEFASLFWHIAYRSAGVRPASIDAIVFQPEAAPSLRKISEEGRLKRLLISGFIATSLIMVLSQRAACNYTFNMGNKYFRQPDYNRAAHYYALACKIYPAFAPAWDKLARSEFRMGKLDPAREHWEKALYFKPDFVEAKLGLSAILVRQGKFEEAEKLIRKAVRLAPTDVAALINLANLSFLTGRTATATELMEKVASQSRGRGQAVGLLARCYHKSGATRKARAILDSNPDALSDPYSGPYCAMAKAEILLDEGNVAEAASLLEPLYAKDKTSPDLLLDIGKLRLSQGRHLEAREVLERASRQAPFNPWISLARARECMARQETDSALELVRRALDVPYTDPFLLAAGARLIEQAGRQSEALELIKEAVRLEPGNHYLISTRDEIVGKHRGQGR